MNFTNWYDRYYQPVRYAHTWPGMDRTRGSCKHSATRKARFKARHA